MIHDFLVDSRPDKHINSCHDAVERILFTTAKHCLKIKNIKNDILSGGFRGGPRGARPPPPSFLLGIFSSFVNVCGMVLRALLFEYIIFNKQC